MMKINFKSRGNTFDLELPGTITQVYGESATGKSYLLSSLNAAVQGGILTEDTKALETLNQGRIVVLTASNSWDQIVAGIQQTGWIIGIDNVNYLLARHKELRDLIWDNVRGNRFILMGRGYLNLGITCFDYMQLKYDQDSRIFTFKPSVDASRFHKPTPEEIIESYRKVALLLDRNKNLQISEEGLQ